MSEYKNRSRSIARDRFWSNENKDQYNCPDCGREHNEIQGTFEVHHKDSDAYNNSIENLVGLCPLCHKLRENKKPTTQEVERLRDAGTTVSVEQEVPANDLFDLKQEIRTACLDNTRKYADVEPSTEAERQFFEAGYAEAKGELRKRFEDIIDSAGGLKCSYCGMTAEKADGLGYLSSASGENIACPGCTTTYAWQNQGRVIDAAHIESHPKKNVPKVTPAADAAFKKLVALLRAKEFGLISASYRPSKPVLSYICEQYAGVSNPNKSLREDALQAFIEMGFHQINWQEETIE